MGAVNMQIPPIKAHNKHLRSVVRRQGRGYSKIEVWLWELRRDLLELLASYLIFGSY
jgi:hypothetical protein